MSHLVLLFWHPQCLPLYMSKHLWLWSVTDRVRPAKLRDQRTRLKVVAQIRDVIRRDTG